LPPIVAATIIVAAAAFSSSAIASSASTAVASAASAAIAWTGVAAGAARAWAGLLVVVIASAAAALPRGDTVCARRRDRAARRVARRTSGERHGKQDRCEQAEKMRGGAEASRRERDVRVQVAESEMRRASGPGTPRE
jgi:hypothetical protein